MGYAPALPGMRNEPNGGLGKMEKREGFRSSEPDDRPEPLRRSAADRMDRILDRAAEKMKALPEGEFEAAVDEALAQVRRR